MPKTDRKKAGALSPVTNSGEAGCTGGDAFQAGPQASKQPQDLSASSQQSRFHIADTAASHQLVDIKGVNLSIGQRDLLQDAHIQLQAGMIHMSSSMLLSTAA